MTAAPPDLLALWQAYSKYVPGSLLGGIVGNAAHGTSGYHIGGYQVTPGDYSVTLPLDRPAFRTTDYCSGIDLTQDRARMKLYTARVIADMRVGGRRTAWIREINGTVDGVHTVNYDASLGHQNYTPDPSHLDHNHLGKYRTITLTAAMILGYIEVCLGMTDGALSGLAPQGGGTPITEEFSVTDDERKLLRADMLTQANKAVAPLYKLLAGIDLTDDQDLNTAKINAVGGARNFGDVMLEVQSGLRQLNAKVDALTRPAATTSNAPDQGGTFGKSSD